MIVAVADDPAEFAEQAARGVFDEAARAAGRGERFSLVLAGGGTPRPVYRRLASPPFREEIDWEATDVFFGDERAVGPDDPGSNFRMARETLLDHVPIPSGNVRRIRGEAGAAEAAREYDEGLRGYLGPDRRFSLVLLGLGADGHTASLFPGSPALDVTDRLAAPAEGAPPYRERITLTLPALTRARAVHFLVAGAAKARRVAEVVRALRGAGPSEVPAARIRPERGSLVWRLDRAAAGELREEEG